MEHQRVRGQHALKTDQYGKGRVRSWQVDDSTLARGCHTDAIVMPYCSHTVAILKSMARVWQEYGYSMASTWVTLAYYLPRGE